MSKPVQSKAVTKGLLRVAQGIPVRLAAQEAGVAPSSLVRARQRAGAEPLPRGRPVLPQRPEVTKGLLLIAQGLSVRLAAKEAGVAPSSLVRARQRAGAEPLPRGRPVGT